MGHLFLIRAAHLTEHFANPSGAHEWRSSEPTIDDARDICATALGFRTESYLQVVAGIDNLAIHGACELGHAIALKLSTAVLYDEANNGSLIKVTETGDLILNMNHC